MRRFLVAVTLLSSSWICADTNIAVNTNNPPGAKGPWLTGPLLTASPHVIPFGHYNFEPYLFVNNTVGAYNNHWQVHRFKTSSNINFQFFTQIGLTPWMDLSIIPQFFYNYRGLQSSWRFGDLLLGTDFQLVKGVHKKHLPSIKFTINELFPTGVYQHLHATNLGTDASGGGYFATTLQFVFGYHWHFYTVHYLTFRTSIGTTLFSPVHVHGLNSYGGDSTTSGLVCPGTAFPVFIGLEYTMTQNWALALDITSTVTLPTNFHGSTINPVGNHNLTYSLTFAPAIEFNYSANIGLIAGLWISAIGKASPTFINYVIAMNWYI